MYGEREPRRVQVEEVVVALPLDPFMSLRALSAYAGLSVRALRGYLAHGLHPLPHYRVGGKVLVRRSDFDSWMLRFRSTDSVRIDTIVKEVLSDLGVEQGGR